MLRVKRAPLWQILPAAALLLLLLAFTLSCSALGVPNSSAEHGTYEAADLNAAKETLADGQKLQDLLHWAISARPKQLSVHEEQKWEFLAFDLVTSLLAWRMQQGLCWPTTCVPSKEFVMRWSKMGRSCLQRTVTRTS